MDFSKVIKKRHSVRKFDSQKKLDKSQIDEFLEAAVLAPSEGNLQPWYFIVVRDTGIKSRLCQAALGQSGVARAPVVIVACIDKEKTSWKYGERGISLYAIQSTALATYNIWLKAVDAGVSACWIGAFNESRISEILDLSENLRPVVLLCLGYSKEEPEITDRESIKNVAKNI